MRVKAKLLFFLILQCLLQFLAAGVLHAAPALYHLNPILGGASSIPLLGGRSVSFRSAWGPQNKIIFEDLMPGANWEHPARIKVLDANGSVLEEISVSLPPVGLPEAPPIWTKGRLR